MFDKIIIMHLYGFVNNHKSTKNKFLFNVQNINQQGMSFTISFKDKTI